MLGIGYLGRNKCPLSSLVSPFIAAGMHGLQPRNKRPKQPAATKPPLPQRRQFEIQIFPPLFPTSQFLPMARAIAAAAIRFLTSSSGIDGRAPKSGGPMGTKNYCRCSLLCLLLVVFVFSNALILLERGWGGKQAYTRLKKSYAFFSRHEVPVSSEKIRIIHMDDDMVVVNKPASIPVSVVCVSTTWCDDTCPPGQSKQTYRRGRKKVFPFPLPRPLRSSTLPVAEIARMCPTRESFGWTNIALGGKEDFCRAMATIFTPLRTKASFPFPFLLLIDTHEF